MNEVKVSEVEFTIPNQKTTGSKQLWLVAFKLVLDKSMEPDPSSPKDLKTTDCLQGIKEQIPWLHIFNLSHFSKTSERCRPRKKHGRINEQMERYFRGEGA